MLIIPYTEYDNVELILEQEINKYAQKGEIA